MRFAAMYLLLACLSACVSAPGSVVPKGQQIQFAQKATRTKVNGGITGRQYVDYLLQVRAQQSLKIAFKPDNPSAYFNLLPPASSAALFIGSTSGNHYEGALRTAGIYIVRVYLMGNAARRSESANYTLEIELTGDGSTGP